MLDYLERFSDEEVALDYRREPRGESRVFKTVLTTILSRMVYYGFIRQYG